MREVARETKTEEKTRQEKPSQKTKGKLSKRTEGGWHERTQKNKRKEFRRAKQFKKGEWTSKKLTVNEEKINQKSNG